MEIGDCEKEYDLSKVVTDRSLTAVSEEPRVA
jgi:hypothetical protein